MNQVEIINKFFNTDSIKHLMDLIVLAKDFKENPTLETIKNSNVYKEGRLSNELLNNWEIGLNSINNKTTAQQLIGNQLLVEIKKTIDSCPSSQTDLTVLDIKNNLLLPTIKVMETVYSNVASRRLHSMLVKIIDDKEKKDELINSAIRVIEPIVKNISDYMGVHEYLYRISKGLEKLKAIDIRLNIKEFLEEYQRKISFIKTGVDSGEKIEVQDNTQLKINDLPEPTKNLIANLMFKEEVNNKDLESSTIFLCLKSIVENLFILEDKFLNEIKELKNFTVKEESDTIPLVTGITILKSLTNRELDESASNVPFESKIESIYTNADMLISLDISTYVGLLKETHDINSITSGLALIFVLMQNIFNDDL